MPAVGLTMESDDPDLPPACRRNAPCTSPWMLNEIGVAKSLGPPIDAPVASNAVSVTDATIAFPRFASLGASASLSDAITPLSINERLLIETVPPRELMRARTVPTDSTGPVARVAA